MYSEKRRSNWWFLLPIFFSLIGGLIAYFILRQDDPAKARNCLYLGMALTFLGIIMGLVSVLFLEPDRMEMGMIFTLGPRSVI